MDNIALTDLFTATWQTVYMVSISGFISIILGLFLGVVLYFKHYKSLGFIINITRSVPFIILMIAIIPLTRLLVGTSIGTNAAIVPLTFAAIPFFARIAESAFAEVNHGLIEAGLSMGANTWQLVNKVLIPEALPSLIKGGTLTIIGLIGYSAMAGAIGGGGLGELAINYGYQRFNVWVMIETVIILVCIVQITQSLGDYFARNRLIKPIKWGSIFFLVISVGAQAWPVAHHPKNVIRVGIIGGVPEQIMLVAKQVALQQFGLNLKLVVFNDYILPNTALNNGNLDANLFQHVPYLDSQIKTRGYDLTPIAKTFVYPMGIYSRKIQSLGTLAEHAIVAIPNDPSNEGRALLLLQQAKLIKINPAAGLFPTPHDIMLNPKQLQFKLLDAAQLPRVFKDASLVALTNDYVAPAGLTVNQALVKETANSPYANVIVVRTQDKNNPLFQKLINTMHSTAVTKATEKAFPNGAAIPAW